jgi:hypothetical protein
MVWVLIACIPNNSCAWELSKEGSGIEVYTRSVKDSGFKEYKGIMTLKASVSSLVALIDDISAYPQWIDTCIQGKRLKRVSPTESYNYTVNEAPWPISNRDAVVRNTVHQDSGTMVVTVDITGVPDFVPLKYDLVRVKEIRGFWRLRPTGKGEVEVVYQVHSEPGGKLPSWLVNAVVVDQPYRTLLNMKEMVRKPRYKEREYEFIREMR